MSEPVRLTHEFFEALIDRPFSVSAGPHTLDLKLTEVKRLPAPRRQTLTGKTVEAPSARLPFSVYFRSEGEMGLKQGTYRFTPPDGGDPLDIFIVPLGFEDGGVIYEAIYA